MLFRSARTALLGATVASLLLLTPRAHGQLFHKSPAPECCPADILGISPTMPGTTPPPGGTTPTTPTTNAPDFSDGGRMVARGEGGFEAPDTGYIDGAVPLNMFRLRFDAAYGDNRPDRAEFFYAKCGCFRAVPVSQGGDPKAPGPPLPETNVDYQDVSAYLELALNKRFSAFVEVPYMFLNPEANANVNGFYDMNAGFKFAFIAEDDLFATFQFRAYFPIGDAGRGLGTDHVSLEPALLTHWRLCDRLYFDAELRDWIPVDGTDFAGNVLRYGAGLSYRMIDGAGWHVDPVVEFVGWSVLSGKELDGETGMTIDSSGETIVNMKLGVRTYFGERNDVYVGWGHALTEERWYRDILRAEYRLIF